MKNLNIRFTVSAFFLLSLLIATPFRATSQINPPASQITVSAIQGFNFGAFYQGAAGGTVEISAAGLRSATGEIVLMNTGAATSPAVFEIEAPAGSHISISSGDAF